jgi:uncharacterized LabA/DUF88 family protein
VRTIVYIDGFNLYYGAVKDTPYKWLDLDALFRRVLQRHHRVVSIKYFTAKVQGRPGDPNAPFRQSIYLQALSAHVPTLQITYGHFLQSTPTMMLAQPIGSTRFAKVLKTEEKGSDVNLALHVLNDAWQKLYDCAVICSNDSDLCEALRMVKKQHRKRIILVVPGNPAQRPPAIQLKRFSDAIVPITAADLAACQLPDPIPNTNFRKPQSW